MDIRKLLKAGESETAEFKATFGKGVIISLTAFANTKGGKVIVGVDDRGRPKGINVGPETEQRYLNEIKVATYPQLIPHITPIAVKGKNLLVFEINEYPIKPIAYKNRYYKRVKNSNHVLSLDEIVDLQQQSLNISFDAHPLDENLSSLDREMMDRFLTKVNDTGRTHLDGNPQGDLTKLKIIRNSKPTLAAALLFGNHGYSIHLGRFKSPDTIIDDLMLKEPLTVAIEDGDDFYQKAYQPFL
jgi:ATP-dependent DNA helicase RecG